MKLFELAELRPRESLRFPLGQLEGFAVRDASGSVHAYLNVCPHRAQPVDIGDGRMHKWPLFGTRPDATRHRGARRRRLAT